jgi:hypothetical protein
MMTTMDKHLKAEIVATVNQAMMEAHETYKEKWLTDEQLCDHIGVFTKRWLKDHGHLLPRTRAEWSDEKGVGHNTSWVYPLHRVQRMLADGEIKRLRIINS